MPLFLDNGVLAVAVPNPGDMHMLTELQKITGHAIQPFVASRTQLLEAIETFYGGSN